MNTSLQLSKTAIRNIYALYIAKAFSRITKKSGFAGRGNRNSIELLIRLTDVNDNAPHFESPEYVFNLKENKAEFSAFVAAFDNDENGTENSVVRYRIVRGDTSENFTIDSVSGK